MDQLPEQTNQHIRNEPSAPLGPNVVLLGPKQWSYVQRQYNLTFREREIAELICNGLLNGSIANHLRIRPGTVKTHTRNIYRKVRVKSKIAMLLRFVADTREISTQ